MSKVLRLVLVAVLIGILFFYFQYNKPHRNIENEAVIFETSVDSIHAEFIVNQTAAYEKYYNKVIALEGVVGFVDDEPQGLINLLLEQHVGKASCELNPDEKPQFWNKKLGKKVKVKGLFIGFDDLLEEVQLKEGSYYQ